MARPLVLAGSGRWYGNDGSWSGVLVEAGTPPQTFEVFPSIQTQNIWLPISDECIRLQNDTGSCGSSRGAAPFQLRPSPGFQRNMSSSWKTINLYGLELGKNHGITGNGLVGFENTTLNGVTLGQFPVTAYAAPGFWVGQIGLLPYPMNYSETISSPSLLSRLKESGRIQSIAYGYQAGASYRGTKVPASLVLGGYDSSRASTPLTVGISTDGTGVLKVAIHDIVATDTLNGTLSLVNEERIFAPIDSSIPELWLPKSICDRFESAFGLDYHEASGRYVLTDAKRDRLRTLNPVVTVTVGSDASISGNTTIIQLPYAAFDLQADYPIFANKTNYFPIRRADNDSQWAIGRAFLQEAYLGVDYESGTFNISAAKWDNQEPNIVPILSRDSITEAAQSHGLSGGAIAGIVVGCVAAVVLFGVSGWWIYKRRRNREQNATVEDSANEKSTCHMGDPPELESTAARVFELQGKLMVSELQESRRPSELWGQDKLQEMPINNIYEMPTERDEERSGK